MLLLFVSCRISISLFVNVSSDGSLEDVKDDVKYVCYTIGQSLSDVYTNIIFLCICNSYFTKTELILGISNLVLHETQNRAKEQKKRAEKEKKIAAEKATKEKKIAAEKAKADAQKLRDIESTLKSLEKKKMKDELTEKSTVAEMKKLDGEIAATRKKLVEMKK